MGRYRQDYNKLPSPDQLCVDSIGSGREGRSSQTEALQKKSIKTEPSLGSWRGANFLNLDRIPKQSRHSYMGLHQLPSLDQLYGGS